jgi:hypothetical protein
MIRAIRALVGDRISLFLQLDDGDVSASRLLCVPEMVEAAKAQDLQVCVCGLHSGARLLRGVTIVLG